MLFRRSGAGSGKSLLLHPFASCRFAAPRMQAARWPNDAYAASLQQGFPLAVRLQSPWGFDLEA